MLGAQKVPWVTGRNCRGTARGTTDRNMTRELERSFEKKRCRDTVSGRVNGQLMERKVLRALSLHIDLGKVALTERSPRADRTGVAFSATHLLFTLLRTVNTVEKKREKYPWLSRQCPLAKRSTDAKYTTPVLFAS